MLGRIVGDMIEKEINSFVEMLEKLSKNTYLKINIEAIKNTINKVELDNEKERVIQENRMVFREQLEDFKIIESRRFIKYTYPHPKSSTLSRIKKLFRLIGINVYRRLLIFSRKIKNRVRKSA
jgi:hypothetical protein